MLVRGEEAGSWIGEEDKDGVSLWILGVLGCNMATAHGGDIQYLETAEDELLVFCR